MTEWRLREGKRSIGRPSTRWTGNIKGIGSNWIYEVQSRQKFEDTKRLTYCREQQRDD